MSENNATLKMLRIIPSTRRIFTFLHNIRYNVSNHEILFCRNCGEFELHRVAVSILGQPRYLRCVECWTVYS